MLEEARVTNPLRIMLGEQKAGRLIVGRASQVKKAEGLIGLDLSLRSAAAAWVPKGWKGNPKHVHVAHWGYELTNEASEKDQAQRRHFIAGSILAFVKARSAMTCRVYVEEYAFSRNSASASGLHELGGVVKDRLFQHGYLFESVTASAARRTLLQKMPKKDSKDFTHDNVRRLKGEALYWNGDEIDAVVVANHGAFLFGWTPLSYPGTVMSFT